MASVSIPLLLKDVTGGVRRVDVEGRTLAEVVAALEALYPGMESRLRKGDAPAPMVAFVVDGKIASAGFATPVGPQSEVNILPSFGGG